MHRFVLKVLPITEIAPGMVLGQRILSEEGKIILCEGTVLTESLLEHLRWWNVPSASIRLGERGPEQLSGQPAGDRVGISPQMFFETYEDTVDNLKNIFQNMRYYKQVPIQQMREVADSAVESLANSIGVMNHLHMVRRKDDYTYHHSVNVAIITGLLGKWLGYQGEELRNLILAGLLHDIGKSQIPLEILNKPGALTETERDVMQLHPELGYNLVKHNESLEKKVRIAIFQHHERMNGTGYPAGLSGENISLFARIIAVADIYDALTSDRVYRKKITPFTVVEMLMEEMFEGIDPAVCMTFLINVRDYFLGNVVELSDGSQGEVIYLGKFLGARPTVRLMNGEFIDLEKRKEIAVLRLVKE